MPDLTDVFPAVVRFPRCERSRTPEVDDSRYNTPAAEIQTRYCSVCLDLGLLYLMHDSLFELTVTGFGV